MIRPKKRRRKSLASKALIRRILSSSFSPANIPGLTVWFDASDASTLTLVGSDVDQMDDKSGNGNHASAPSSVNRPNLVSEDQNGLDVINFGFNEYLALTSTLAGDSVFSGAAIFKRDLDSRIVAILGDSGNFGPYVSMFAGGTVGISDTGGSSDGISRIQPAETIDSYVVLSFVKNATGGELYINGSILTGGSDFTPGWSGSFNNVGRRRSDFSVGQIGEIILHHGVEYAISERESIESYLSIKWGIALVP